MKLTVQVEDHDYMVTGEELEPLVSALCDVAVSHIGHLTEGVKVEALDLDGEPMAIIASFLPGLPR